MSEREYIYILKASAIFFVICAHVSFVPDNADIISIKCGEFLNYLGTMGVPIFFILSGYLFEKNKKKFLEFWKGKFKSIIIPWIFCETLLWIYVVVRKGEVGFIKWLLFILGYNHSTYYLSVLLILYVFFWRKMKNKELYVMLILSIFSMVSTGWHIGLDFFNSLFGTFYLNPLNWISFFGIGIIISRKDILIKYASWCSKRKEWMMLLSFAYFFVMIIEDEYIYYFSKYAIFAHTVNTFFIMGVGYSFLTSCIKRKRIIIYIGEVSFSIYLLHQLVTGVVLRITNEINSFFAILIRPFIVLFTILIVIYLVQKTGKGRFKLLRVLLGVK